MLRPAHVNGAGGGGAGGGGGGGGGGTKAQVEPATLSAAFSSHLVTVQLTMTVVNDVAGNV